MPRLPTSDDMKGNAPHIKGADRLSGRTPKTAKLLLGSKGKALSTRKVKKY